MAKSATNLNSKAAYFKASKLSDNPANIGSDLHALILLCSFCLEQQMVTEENKESMIEKM